LPAAVKEQYKKDIDELTQTLQNWQQIASQAVQNKQNQLLAPVMRKIQEAIQSVAKEKGYTYVVSREAIIIAPDADNMLPAVAKKLNITVPPQLMPGYKPPVGAANNQYIRLQIENIRSRCLQAAGFLFKARLAASTK
jgi:outer membrane protein